MRLPIHWIAPRSSDASSSLSPDQEPDESDRRPLGPRFLHPQQITRARNCGRGLIAMTSYFIDVRFERELSDDLPVLNLPDAVVRDERRLGGHLVRQFVGELQEAYDTSS